MKFKSLYSYRQVHLFHSLFPLCRPFLLMNHQSLAFKHITIYHNPWFVSWEVFHWFGQSELCLYCPGFAKREREERDRKFRKIQEFYPWQEALFTGEMGNIESLGNVNVAQLRDSCSRVLDLSRSLTYEQYQEVGYFITKQALLTLDITYQYLRDRRLVKTNIHEKSNLVTRTNRRSFSVLIYLTSLAVLVLQNHPGTLTVLDTSTEHTPFM